MDNTSSIRANNMSNTINYGIFSGRKVDFGVLDKKKKKNHIKLNNPIYYPKHPWSLNLFLFCFAWNFPLQDEFIATINGLL
jgi:hypothetical protein